MTQIKLTDNLIIERRIHIAEYLVTFFPKDIAKLIGKYDYYLEGKSHIFSKQKDDLSINCIFVLLDGHRLVYGSYDHTLKILDIFDENNYTHLIKHESWVNCVTVLPNGRIVSGASDQKINVWDSTTGNVLPQLMNLIQYIV
jgi:WD40 repeat protein